jgi:DNA-directed RNA polymerase specialized sigma24 family protein
MTTSNDSLDQTELFYSALKNEGVDIRAILGPLDTLGCRERSVFIEYHYWNTHMKLIASSHKISLGRTYEILYRAERKIKASRAQEAQEESGSIS